MTVIDGPAAGSAGGPGGLPTLLGANLVSKGGQGEEQQKMITQTLSAVTEVLAMTECSESEEPAAAAAVVVTKFKARKKDGIK